MTTRIRCAIYTRKSSEEGLDQSFNSLHAQREACEAFIQSQKHEGWSAIATQYDDGGFSGGNMDRPALKKLMEDIAAGKVNTVVVYKVDRLTRSLADFAKIIEQFDARGVSFVSVTQQFNTTTSMGRLTLNVLLSFAQFEREVTGERIRDKIAASKAKGMWMGGAIPLGYDLRDRKLHVNPGEAEQVREIFRQYLRVRTVPSLMVYLKTTQIRSKSRKHLNDLPAGGRHYSRGGLYQLLRSRIYIGEIEHKGSFHPGQHEAIVDRGLWTEVQELLNQNRQGARSRGRKPSGSMLTGVLFSQSGVRYIPTNTQKGGRRYYYYTSQALIKGNKEEESVGRLPAPAIEAAVTERIQNFLKSQPQLLEALKESDEIKSDYPKLLNSADRIASELARISCSERAERIRLILHRVVVSRDSIEVRINLENLIQLLSGGQPNPSSGTDIRLVSLRTSFRHIPQGKALRLVIENQPVESSASRGAIARAIARTRSWYEDIVQGRASGPVDLARKYGLTNRYVEKIFPLAFLGPESVEFLLSDTGSHLRTLNSLMGKVPMCWDQQKEYLMDREGLLRGA